MLRTLTELGGYPVLDHGGNVGRVEGIRVGERPLTVRGIVVATPATEGLVLPASACRIDGARCSLHVAIRFDGRARGAAPAFAIPRVASGAHAWPRHLSPLPARPRGAPVGRWVPGAASNGACGAWAASGLDLAHCFVADLGGDIGHVDTLVIDDGSWSIPYLVVDISASGSGRRLLVDTALIEEIRRESTTLCLGLSRRDLSRAPAWSPHAWRRVNRRIDPGVMTAAPFEETAPMSHGRG
jgi:hypothetical protein